MVAFTNDGWAGSTGGRGEEGVLDVDMSGVPRRTTAHLRLSASRPSSASPEGAPLAFFRADRSGPPSRRRASRTRSPAWPSPTRSCSRSPLWLLLRGNRLGLYATVALSALGLAGAVIYLFYATNAAFMTALVAGGLNALVLYLLLGTQSAREYFGRA